MEAWPLEWKKFMGTSATAAECHRLPHSKEDWEGHRMRPPNGITGGLELQRGGKILMGYNG